MLTTTIHSLTGNTRDSFWGYFPGKAEFSKVCMALSLSEIEVTSLLDEVPVDLRCGHVNVRNVNRFTD